MNQVPKFFISILLIASIFYFLGSRLFSHSLMVPRDTQTFYSPVAVNLLEGKGYTLQGEANFRYPPLFPVFLAFIYKVSNHSGTLNKLYLYIILFLQSLSCGLLYLSARRMIENGRAFLAAILLLSYPFFAVLSITQYAWTVMPLFIFLFFFSILCFIMACDQLNFFYFALSGWLLGLSALTWPAAIGLWILFTGKISMNFRKEKFFKQGRIFLFLFLMGFGIPIIFWSFFIFQKTGKIVLISTGGLPSVKDGVLRKSSSLFGEYEFVKDARQAAQDKELKAGGDILNFSFQELRKKPLATFKYLIFKVFRPWYGTDAEKHEGKILLVQTVYLALAILGIFVSIRQKRPHTFFFVGIVLYFWLVAFCVLSILRYMIPAMAILMIFAANGIDYLFQKLKFIKRNSIEEQGTHA